jgi:hypothetical protein
MLKLMFLCLRLSFFEILKNFFQKIRIFPKNTVKSTTYKMKIKVIDILITATPITVAFFIKTCF